MKRWVVCGVFVCVCLLRVRVLGGAKVVLGESLMLTEVLCGTLWCQTHHSLLMVRLMMVWLTQDPPMELVLVLVLALVLVLVLVLVPVLVPVLALQLMWMLNWTLNWMLNWMLKLELKRMLRLMRTPMMVLMSQLSTPRLWQRLRLTRMPVLTPTPQLMLKLVLVLVLVMVPLPLKAVVRWLETTTTRALARMNLSRSSTVTTA